MTGRRQPGRELGQGEAGQREQNGRTHSGARGLETGWGPGRSMRQGGERRARSHCGTADGIVWSGLGLKALSGMFPSFTSLHGCDEVQRARGLSPVAGRSPSPLPAAVMLAANGRQLPLAQALPSVPPFQDPFPQGGATSVVLATLQGWDGGGVGGGGGAGQRLVSSWDRSLAWHLAPASLAPAESASSIIHVDPCVGLSLLGDPT
uniref:Uncharacterized protein n=1 Tax=Rangifer tarandus platyrhynchus TaxID=3082113 RepID=A0ACB0EI28_RANTA|nr:unnamed protein product [Rangifer tarandus platyrhynchus]